jgi:hypothetical protein
MTTNHGLGAHRRSVHRLLTEILPPALDTRQNCREVRPLVRRSRSLRSPPSAGCELTQQTSSDRS